MIHQNSKDDINTFDDIEVEVVSLNVVDRGRLLHKEVYYLLCTTTILIVFLLILANIFKTSLKISNERYLILISITVNVSKIKVKVNVSILFCRDVNEINDLLITDNNRDYWSQSI